MNIFNRIYKVVHFKKLLKAAISRTTNKCVYPKTEIGTGAENCVDPLKYENKTIAGIEYMLRWKS